MLYRIFIKDSCTVFVIVVPAKILIVYSLIYEETIITLTLRISLD